MVGEHALTIRNLGPHDAPSVLRLHRSVFGPETDQHWYEWKYGQHIGQGKGEAVGVWRGDELVAHCGGLPRTLWRQGQQVRGMQIGDVMVAPSWRGILTRRGPFAYVSQSFYNSRLGFSQAHQIGYGFPSERHLRLAVTLKLLWDGGSIHTLSWRATGDGPVHRPLGWGWKWEELSPARPDFDRSVNSAWIAMRLECNELTLGQRNADYVRWRFVERPQSVAQPRQHRFFQLRRGWSTQAAGIAVMDLRAPQAMWLDWIGPRRQMREASVLCRMEAAKVGASHLCAWASPAVVEALTATGIESSSIAARLGVPTTSTLSEGEITAMKWWLMAGDTDFL